MTETKNHIPQGYHDDVHIEFDKNNQPMIYFDKLCLEAVTIERSINSGSWDTVGKNVRSPYLDQIPTNHAEDVKYRVRFGEAEGEIIMLKVNFPE